MCGRLNISDDPFVTALVKQLGVSNPTDKMRFGRFKRAADTLSIVHRKNGITQISDAIWWLLLDQTDSGFKPSKYTSFNTRYDKLNVYRSAGYQPFRQSRCIIPAKGFGETEFVNKKPLHYYDFECQSGEAIALGGLYREWIHPHTGEIALSCSVITLPPHEKLKSIHSKAMPLILPQQGNLLDMWLDQSFHHVDEFQQLLQPHLPQSLTAYQINKPSEFQAVSPPVYIAADN